MGDVVVIDDWLADRSRPTRDPRPAFFFDLACPFSYLAAERVERVLGEVEWIPAASAVLRDVPRRRPLDEVRAEAEWRALELRLPLVWPERFPASCPSALAAASHAAEVGACRRFALAASRLAFCGGFDLEDPEILAEAASAAGIRPGECLAAARDPERAAVLEATARGLRSRGVSELPAVRVGRRWFAGESALDEAAILVRTLAAQRDAAAGA
jgi:2-hydroxychromene-2-carboxylate isomerase